MPFLVKLWKMSENIDILNLSQQKEEKSIWCQKQTVILKSFHRKSSNNENGKKQR